MLITIKTLQSIKYPLEVDPNDTVLSLKNRIESELQLGTAAAQKLIKAGKILNDDQTLLDSNIKDKDIVIVMLTKTKAKTTPAPAAPIQSTAPATAAPIQSTAPATAAPIQSTAPAPAAPIQSTAPATAAPIQSTEQVVEPASTATPADTQPLNYQSVASNLVTGQQLQSMVASIEAMGFPHDEVVHALRASFNNPERAVEYLFNGIPPEAEAMLGHQSRQQAPPAQAVNSPPAQAVNSPPAQAVNSPPAQAVNSPASPMPMGVQQLAALAAQNPALFQQTIQHALEQNGDDGDEQTRAMLQMLADPQVGPALLAQMSRGAPPGHGHNHGHIPGEHVISVTPEEKASIDQLESMGFSRDKVLEAYLACDKNEELAANYLFDHAFDEDPAPQ